MALRTSPYAVSPHLPKAGSVPTVTGTGVGSAPSPGKAPPTLTPARSTETPPANKASPHPERDPTAASQPPASEKPGQEQHFQQEGAHPSRSQE